MLKGEMRKAYAKLKKNLKLDKKNPETEKNVIEFHIRNNNLDNAIENLNAIDSGIYKRKTIKLLKEVDRLIIKGKKNIRERNFDKALKYLDNAIEKLPYYPQGYLYKAYIYLHQNRFDDVFFYIDKAFAINKDLLTMGYLLKGIVHRTLYQYKKSEMNFTIHNTQMMGTCMSTCSCSCCLASFRHC